MITEAFFSTCLIQYVFVDLRDHRSRSILLNYDVLKDCVIWENSKDPDELPHNAAFHLGLHCLSKYINVHVYLFVPVYRYPE